MNCVCCGKRIKEKDSKATTWINNIERNSCWTCNVEGAFQQWIVWQAGDIEAANEMLETNHDRN